MTAHPVSGELVRTIETASEGYSDSDMPLNRNGCRVAALPATSFCQKLASRLNPRHRLAQMALVEAMLLAAA